MARVRRMADGPRHAPPVAALLTLRLCHHARALQEDCDPAPFHELIAWANEQCAGWAQCLAGGSMAARQGVLAKDQPGLLLGIVSITDARVRAAAGDAYRDCIASVAALGLNPVVARSQPLVDALLRGTDEPWAEACLDALPASQAPSPTLPHDAGAGAVARVALLQSLRGARGAELDPALAALIEALALSAARRADCGDAGLMLMASMVLCRRPLPAGLPDWLHGVRRSDGLIGIWDLDFDSDGGLANLAATTHAWLGLHALHAPQVPLVPRVERPTRGRVEAGASISTPDPSASRRRAALDKLLAWLAPRLVHFDVAGEQGMSRYRARLKALTEIASLTRVLAGPRHEHARDVFAGWLDRAATFVIAQVCQEALIEGLRDAPALAPFTRIYAMADELHGRPLPFHDEARDLARARHAAAREKTPLGEIEYAYLCDAFGLTAPGIDRCAAFERSVIARSDDALRYTRDDLYDLTHLVFFGTDFGARDVAELGAGSAWLQRELPALTLSCMAEGDYDVAGELLACASYCQVPRRRSTHSASLLCDAVEAGDAVELSLQGDADDWDDAVRHYHTVLTSILALAEYGRGD